MSRINVMRHSEWSSDQTLGAVYRGTVEEYTQKYNAMTPYYFDNIQHEIQHKNKKPSKHQTFQELLTGIGPVTSALPMRRSTD